MVDECIKREKVSDIKERILSLYSEGVLNGQPVLQGDFLDIDASLLAGMIFETQGDIKKLEEQIFVSSMCCENLYKFGEKIGFTPSPPTRSKGFIRVSGAVGTMIPSNISFIGGDNVQFQVDSNSTFSGIIGADGFGIVPVRSVDIGGSVNFNDGYQFQLATTFTDIDPVAVSAGDIYGGSELETCEQLRARILQSQKSVVVVGNVAWYEAELLRFQGVTKVCHTTDDCGFCCDSNIFSAYVFMEDLYPPYGIPLKEPLDEITAELWGNPQGSGLGRAPLGHYGNLKIAEPCLVDVKVQAISDYGIAAEERIKTVVDEFFKTITCVGEEICLSELDSVISQSLGGGCFVNTTLTSTCGALSSHSNRIYAMDTGFFPVVNQISFCTGANR